MACAEGWRRTLASASEGPDQDKSYHDHVGRVPERLAATKRVDGSKPKGALTQDALSTQRKAGVGESRASRIRIGIQGLNLGLFSFSCITQESPEL